MPLDDRIREELQTLIDSEDVSSEPFLKHVRSRGHRRRVAFLSTITAASLVIAAAGGAATIAIKANRDNVEVNTSSRVLRTSSTNVEGTAQISSTRVRVNEIFTITTTITKYNRLDGYVDIDTGDGRHHPGGPSMPGCGLLNTRPLPTRRNGSGIVETSQYPYAYRQPGRHHVSITFHAYRVCSNGPDESPAPVRFDIIVTDGPHRSAGPLPPQITQGGINEANGLLHLDASFSSDDSWVSRVILDWGDGTHKIYDFPLSKCVDPLNYWPSSDAYVYDRHPVGKTGQHTLTFTVTSSGCDGASPRTTTIAHDFQTPLTDREYLAVTILHLNSTNRR